MHIGSKDFSSNGYPIFFFFCFKHFDTLENIENVMGTNINN